MDRPTDFDGVLPRGEVERALAHQREHGGSLADAVVRLGLLSEREALRTLASGAGLQYLAKERAERLRPPEELLERVPVRLAEAHRAFPFREDSDRTLWVVVAAPLDEEGERALREAAAVERLRAVLAREAVVRACIRRHYYRDPQAFQTLDEPSRRPTPVEHEEVTTSENLHPQALTREVVAIIPPDITALERENERLRVAQRFAGSLAGVYELEGLADRVLGSLFEVLPADAGTLLLTGDHGRPLLMESRSRPGRPVGPVKLSTSVVRAVLESERGLYVLDARSDRRFDSAESVVTRRPRAVLAAPIRSTGASARTLGAIYLESDDAGAFGAPDVELLTLLGGQVAVVVETVRWIQQREFEIAQREALGRFLAPELVDEVTRAAVTLPVQGERLECSVVVADVRGFRAWLCEQPAGAAVASLEAHVTELASVGFRHGGAFLECVGDAALVLFGAPVRHEDHAERAVVAAVGMIEACARRRAEREGFQIGVGLATGELVVGGIGAGCRRGYAALGAPVELAHQLARAAGPGEVLASARTQQLAGRFHSWKPGPEGAARLCFALPSPAGRGS